MGSILDYAVNGILLSVFAIAFIRTFKSSNKTWREILPDPNCYFCHGKGVINLGYGKSNSKCPCTQEPS